ncbi:MAG: type II toxin-antitoxin system PemK/MazF family toxin [Gaiellaceae bacterium MAG52_C11]|nr:type II toxin-antitoxin system PemK/MazF family toxin [Candidatus Gaiellasilicea maunaloa]
MRRGEVWWVERPGVGRRPHLVLTRDAAVPVLNSVLAVPATTTVRGIATEVELDREDGMPTHCALSLDNLRVLRKSYFANRICSLDTRKMAEVCRALGRAAGCDG